MTARATPSILSKGFFWFLFCSQIEHKSVLSVKSVVERKEPLRGKNKKPSSGVLLSGQNIQCFILPIVLLLLPYGKIRLL